MGIAGILAEDEAVALMRLDREGEEAPRASAPDAPRGTPHRAPPCRRTRPPPPRDRPRRGRARRGTRRARPRAGHRRASSSRAFSSMRGERSTPSMARADALQRLRHQPGAAAEIEGEPNRYVAQALRSRRGAGHRRSAPGRDRRGFPVRCRSNLRRIIVEERPHIAVRDRLLGRERAEPGEIEPHAERILRFERERLAARPSTASSRTAQLGQRPPEQGMGGREVRGAARAPAGPDRPRPRNPSRRRRRGHIHSGGRRRKSPEDRTGRGLRHGPAHEARRTPDSVNASRLADCALRHPISGSHGAAFHRHPHPDPARALLPPRRLPHRSGPAREAGADHPWPFRPCPLGPPRRHGDRGRPCGSWRVRYGEDFAGSTQEAPLRRDASASAT